MEGREGGILLAHLLVFKRMGLFFEVRESEERKRGSGVRRKRGMVDGYKYLSRPKAG